MVKVKMSKPLLSWSFPSSERDNLTCTVSDTDHFMSLRDHKLGALVKDVSKVVLETLL